MACDVFRDFPSCFLKALWSAKETSIDHYPGVLVARHGKFYVNTYQSVARAYLIFSFCLYRGILDSEV